MNERDPAHLWDMRAAALELTTMLEGVSLADFRRSVMLCRATERCLEIIGEGARRVSDECTLENPQIPWRRIIGQRNILAHEYGQVDHDLVYATATRDVAELIAQLNELLAATDASLTEG